SCFDYKSKEACLIDSCNAAGNFTDIGNKGCRWHDTFPSLGEGFCYDEDYEGTSKCSFCNEEGSIFKNFGCTQEVCSMLGSCFATGEGSCSPCPANPKCSDLTSEQACVAANGFTQPFEISDGGTTCLGTPIVTTSSNDACGIGKCRWTGSVCVKDSNGNSVDDCRNLVGPALDLCINNNKALTTKLHLDTPLMNASGKSINFTADSLNADKFYFCLKEGCCPSSASQDILAFNKNNISFNPLVKGSERGVAFDDDVVYAVRYYTKDKYENIEQVKTKYSYIDTIKPKFNVDAAKDYGPDYSKSDLIVTVTSDPTYEYLRCTYSITGLNPDNYDTAYNQGKWSTQPNTTFQVKFKGLNDGIYQFKVACRDDVNNTNVTITDIEMNRLTGIENVKINGKAANSAFDERKFNFNSPTISFTTTDPATCTLAQLVTQENIGGPSAGAFAPQTITSDQTPGLGSYSLAYTAANVPDGSYDIQITCDFVNSEDSDSADVIFSIDTKGPRTIILDEDGNEFIFGTDVNKIYHKPGVKVKFSCEDIDSQPEEIIPGEFGCEPAAIRYVLSPSLPKSDSSLPQQVYGYADRSPDYTWAAYNGNYLEITQNGAMLTYYSTDKGSNKEIRQAYTADPTNTLRKIFIDPTPPTVAINPLGEAFRKTPDTVTITGTAQDDAYYSKVIAKVTITVTNSTLGTKSYDAVLTPAASGVSYQAVVDLDINNNIITAVAYDGAGNPSDSVSVSLYLDQEAPAIVSSSVKEPITNKRVDSGCSANCFNAEYKSSLQFSWKVTDAGSGVNAGTNFVFIDCISGTCLGLSTIVGKMTEFPTGSGQFTYTYDTALQELLEVGQYRARFNVYDNVGNSAEKILTFNIMDTVPPGLKIVARSESAYYPPAESEPKTVYTPYINITGITDPDTDVLIGAYNGNNLNRWDSTVRSAPVSTPKLTGIAIGTNSGRAHNNEYVGYYPAVGDNILYFDGQDLTTHIQAGDYIELKDELGQIRYEVPRYKVLTVTPIDMPCGVGLNFCSTRVTISPSLRNEEKAISLGWKVDIYGPTGSIPTGWFDKKITLHGSDEPQPNQIAIGAQDTHGQARWAYTQSSIDADNDGLDDGLLHIYYVSDATAGITVNKPSIKYNAPEGEILIQRNSEFTIEISTDWPSDCRIAHT
ncbi:MAG: hypothetical protein KJ922_00915, partial [Nanoarchaeota archaeon]|nr:hypothetical protein [Nanoarchaeota archaeon]